MTRFIKRIAQPAERIEKPSGVDPELKSAAAKTKKAVPFRVNGRVTGSAKRKKEVKRTPLKNVGDV